MTDSDNLTTLKGKLRKHRFLYSLANIPYPAPQWNKSVRNLIDELGTKAEILDLGAGTRRRAEHVINLEIETMPNVDIVADGHYLPFRSETFDAVILEAVLEHVQNPQQMVAEIRRILKKGGYICAAAPFLQGYHAAPHDYRRYTTSGFELLFADFQKLASGPCAGPTATLHWIFREYVGLLLSCGNLWLAKFISIFIGWLTFPIVFLDSALKFNKHAHILASAVYFIGRKE
ncbi:TPA: class I SAM-dependent methyltransferase [Candidatus Poribacteria bacterium]|nr:class I SAM-dependent methyltransferase [Candidatus Poribacteria bacterium]